jgi:predicted TIM-barrel fold metal-dependent hydrolase
MTRLIDVHRHLWGYDWFPPSHLRNTASRIARGRPIEEALDRIRQSPSMEATGAGAISEMEHYGIDVSFIMTLDWGMAYGPDEDNILPAEEFHRLTYEVCKKYPGKLYAMCGMDPRRPRVTAFFEECVKNYGAVGYKLYPPNGYQANAEFCWPIYRKCVELDVPILIHVDSSSMWTMPEWVAEVARAMPDLRIMMGHTNLQSPFETGAYWRGLITGRADNIWLDLCDWQALGAVTDENIPELLKVIRVFLDRKGPERIVWGTDLPQAGVGGKARAQNERWVDIFKNLPEWGNKYGITFSERERDGICFEAAESVYRNVFKK